VREVCVRVHVCAEREESNLPLASSVVCRPSQSRSGNNGVMDLRYRDSVGGPHEDRDSGEDDADGGEGNRFLKRT
jgi:hypothetical protein